MNISDSSVNKYYITQKGIIFLTLTPINKSANFGLKKKLYYLLLFLFREKKKKKRKINWISDSHFTVRAGWTQASDMILLLNSFTSNYLFLVKKKKEKNTPFVLFSDKGEVQQRTRTATKQA